MEDTDEQTSSDANGPPGKPPISVENEIESDETSLYSALHRLVTQILCPDPASSLYSSSLFRRIKTAVKENAPSVREGSKNSGRKLLLWTKRGSPLRALLVISVGTIIFLALTGLLIFMVFFLAATAHAVIISFFISLAAAGSVSALFFGSVTAIYIGAVSIAFFVISTGAVSTMIAVVITTGWIGFFWIVWVAAKKCLDFAKHSLYTTLSALSAYSAARHAHILSPEKI